MASIKVVAQSVVPVNMDIFCVMARRASHAMARGKGNRAICLELGLDIPGCFAEVGTSESPYLL